MIDREELALRGATTIDLLTPHQLARLRAAYTDLCIDGSTAFSATSNDPDRDLARRAQEAIVDVLAPALAARAPDHEPFLASFLVKGPQDGARIEFHQDLTYCDERRTRAMLVWVPLVDVDASNGALSVVAGSHRWTNGSRPSGQQPLPTARWQDAFAARSELLPLAAGSAVVYDAGVVHGSPPNRSAEARVAAAVALVPTGTQLIHVHRRGDGTDHAYEVDRSFHVDQGLLNEPTGYREVDLWAPAVAADDFAGPLRSTVPPGSSAS